MKKTRFLAAGLMGLMLLASVPKATLADGAASTRNILIGVGAAAATLVIINHNKKVHQKYAEDAQKQAALAEQRDDAQAAARQYKVAYEHESVVASELKKEVAIQQSEISKLQTAMTSLNPPGSNFVAAKPAAATMTNSVSAVPSGQVVSYGWGTF
jgi:hypothetical protein